MKVPFTDLGQIGIIKDHGAHELQPNAFSDGNNVVFRDGLLSKITGHGKVFGTPSCRPSWLLPYRDPASNAYYWLYPGLTDASAGVIYSYDGTNHTNRTRGSGNYTPSALTPYTGGVSNGLPFINNGVDIPQKWDRTGTALKATMEDFANWPSGYKAKVLRPYREFIVALDIDDGSAVRNPYRVMWGDPPGAAFTEPTTWIAAAGNLAGDIYLNESGGYAIDCLPLRNVNVIYAQSATYAMRYIGGNRVFSIDLMFSEYGILAPRCAKPFRDGRHFVVTTGDIITHDGVTAVSVADKRVRELIFSEIDDTNYHTSFVAPNYDKEEMWFCYPTTGNSLPNKCAIMNVTTGAWSFRDLDNISHIAYGVIDTGVNVWDDDTAAWDSDDSVWDSPDFNPTKYNLLMAQHESTAATSLFHRADHLNLFNGSAYTAFAQRTGLDIAALGQTGYIRGPEIVKDIDRVSPKLTGGPVEIRIGTCDSVDGTYTWQDYQTFDPSTQFKLDFRANGRYWGWEIRSTGDVSWQVESMDFGIKAENER